jgi:hypothetical protein
MEIAAYCICSSIGNCNLPFRREHLKKEICGDLPKFEKTGNLPPWHAPS